MVLEASSGRLWVNGSSVKGGEKSPSKLMTIRPCLRPTLLLGIAALALLLPGGAAWAVGPSGPGSGDNGSFSAGGFGGGSSSDMGNGESVDILTGDLAVRHPVAIPIQGDGGMGISVARVYQSRSAESAPMDIDNRVQRPYSWVGYRWTLTMGRISVHGMGTQAYYVYEDAAGGQHRLYESSDTTAPAHVWKYTVDGSYLRAQHLEVGTETDHWMVFFPDGSTQKLGYRVGEDRNSLTQPDNTTSSQALLNADEAGWYATRNKDTYGNAVNIFYYKHMSGVPLDDGDTMPSGTILPQSIYKIIEDKASAPRSIKFRLACPIGGGVNLLSSVEWAGVGGAIQSESYAYVIKSGYNYPLYTASATPQDVPFLYSVTRPGQLVTAYDYACTEGTYNGMSQVDGSANWQLKLGARLTDIYYPTGLRSHYDYAQDQFNYAATEPLNDLPHPPGVHPAGGVNHLNVLMPDEENWVYHSGVGVTKRVAYVWNPSPASALASPVMGSLSTGGSNVLALTWTWNRYGIRNISPQAVDMGHPPHVITSDPMGREVMHGFGYFSYIENFDQAYNKYRYSSVAPFETVTAVYTKPFGFPASPDSMEEDLYKKVEQTWSFQGLGSGTPGDVAKAEYVDKAGYTNAVDGGNPSVGHVVSRTSWSGDRATTIANSGWDGYGHYEQVTVAGEGIPNYCGVTDPTHVTFSKYRLVVDPTLAVYRIDQPIATGSLECIKDQANGADLAVRYITYTYRDGDQGSGMNVSGISVVDNAAEDHAPSFEPSGDQKGRLIIPTYNDPLNPSIQRAYWESSAENGDLLTTTAMGPHGDVTSGTVSTSNPVGTSFTKSFTYQNGQITSLTQGGAEVWKREFDNSTGLLKTETDENQFVATTTRDALGRPTSITSSAAGEPPTHFYYPSGDGGSVPLAVLPGGSTVSFPIVLNRQVVQRGATVLSPVNGDYLTPLKILPGESGSETITDGLGRPVFARTVAADTTTITRTQTAYGPDGRAVYQTQPHTEASITNLFRSIPCAFRDPACGTCSPTPYVMTLVLTTGVPATYTSVYFGATNDSPFPAVLGDGNMWAFDYLDRPLRIFTPTTDTASEDGEVAYGYSPSGLTQSVTHFNIAGTTGPISSTTTYVYNCLGRLVAVDGPAGGADAIYDYDVNGKLCATRLVEALPVGGTPDLVHPSEIQEHGFIQPYENSGIGASNAGQVRTFTYDALGRTLWVNNPNSLPQPTLLLEQGAQQNLTFDALGNVLTQKDAKGLISGDILSRGYDSRGRVTSLWKVPTSGGSTHLGSWSYDQSADHGFYYKGRLTRAETYRDDGKGTVVEDYIYNGPGGRLSTKRVALNLSGLGGPLSPSTSEIRYAYSNGRLTEETAYLDQAFSKTIRSTYTHGALASKKFTDSSKGVSTITYHPSGALKEITSTNTMKGTYLQDGGIARLGSIQWTAPGGTEGPWAYAYDGAGNIKSITRGGRSDTFAYDALDRLQSATVYKEVGTSYPSSTFQSTSFSYTHDPWGNLAGRTVTQSQLPAADQRRFYFSATMATSGGVVTNHIQTLTRKDPATGNPTTSTQAYDDNGNTTNDGILSLTYSAINKVKTSTSNGTTEELFYDSAGEKAAVVKKNAASGRVVEATYYTRSGSLALAEETHRFFDNAASQPKSDTLKILLHVGSNVAATQESTSYALSGTVMSASGGLNGVTVQVLSGGSLVTTVTTVSGGKYQAGLLPVGTYTLIPLLSGYTFSPATASVTIGADPADPASLVRDFTASVCTGRTLIYNVSPAGFGTISTTPTTANGACLNAGASVSLTATARPGYVFLRWVVTCPAPCTTSTLTTRTITLTMDAHKTAVAYFKKGITKPPPNLPTTTDGHQDAMGRYQILLSWEDEPMEGVYHQISYRMPSEAAFMYSDLLQAEHEPELTTYSAVWYPPQGCKEYEIQVRVFDPETGEFSDWSAPVLGRATPVMPSPPLTARHICLATTLGSRGSDKLTWTVAQEEACAYTSFRVYASLNGMQYFVLHDAIPATGGTAYGASGLSCGGGTSIGNPYYQITGWIGDQESGPIQSARRTFKLQDPVQRIVTDLSQPAVKLADLSGDVAYDMVLQCAYFKASPDGTFTDASTELTTTAGDGDGILVADMDGDGYLDRVLSHKRTLWVEYHGGEGFTLGPAIEIANDITDFAVGYVPLNLDATLRVVAATKTGIALLAFSPEAGWSLDREIPTDLQAESVVLGDANNDGLTDIMAGGKKGARLFYTTTEDFGTWHEDAVVGPGLISSVDLADVNGDGFLDVAVGRQTKDDPLVYLFAPVWGEDLDVRPVPHAWVAGALPEGIDLPNVRQVTFADLSGSGVPGLFCVTEQARQSAYFDGDGAGGLLGPGRVLPGQVTAVAVGDTDSNRTLDFVVVGNKTLDVYQGYFEEVPDERVETTEENEPPTAPVLAGAEVRDGVLLLTWHPAADDRTPPASLTYEVIGGTDPSLEDLFLGEVGPTQTSSRRGFAQTSTQTILPYPAGRTEVYWGVQAVDAAHVRGPWLRGVTWPDGTTIILEGTAQAPPTGGLPRGDARGGNRLSRAPGAAEARGSAKDPIRHSGDGLSAEGGEGVSSGTEETPSVTDASPSRAEVAVPTVHHFFGWDHVGSIRIETDDTGVIKARYDYEPYGIQIVSGTEPATGNNRLYTSQERDSVTGLGDLHFRFYQDAIGRFLKPDNIAGNVYNPQSWNRYSYCNGNPVNLIDPNGHAPGYANMHYKFGGFNYTMMASGGITGSASDWARIANQNATAADNALANAANVIDSGLNQDAPNSYAIAAGGGAGLSVDGIPFGLWVGPWGSDSGLPYGGSTEITVTPSRGYQGEPDLPLNFLSTTPIEDFFLMGGVKLARCLWGALFRGGASLATNPRVWWRMFNMGTMRPGTQVPYSFSLEVSGVTYNVVPNATKHLAEYSVGQGVEIPMSSLAGALETAQGAGLAAGRNFVTIEGWELGIDTSSNVVYHALYRP